MKTTSYRNKPRIVRIRRIKQEIKSAFSANTRGLNINLIFMYTQSYFKQTDQEQIVQFMRQNSFAAIISHDGERQVATHVPVEVDEDADGNIFLLAHVARANPQWRSFAESTEVLTIFTGAHVYVSPRWYEEPFANVPTWNYSAVHAYGRPQIIEGAELIALLKRLVDRYEQGTDYSLERIAPEMIEKQSKAIVGVRIAVHNLEAKYKLSQNHNAVTFANIINELEKQGDENSLAVAAAMRGQIQEK